MLEKHNSKVPYCVVYFAADWFEVCVDGMCTRHNIPVILIWM